MENKADMGYSTDRETENQISVIRNILKTIIHNARYGSNENLLKDLYKIESITSKIHAKTTGTPLIKKYTNILVPYDGSSYSKRALSEALEIAKAFDSKITLLSVIEIATDVPSDVLSEVLTKKIQKLKREISLPKKFKLPTNLQNKINEFTKNGQELKLQVLIGKASDTILQFADNNKIELIIIGSKGLRGMKKIVALGSVSRRVSEEAKCPVLIIR